MGLIDTKRFEETLGGQLLRRIAELGNEGAPPDGLGLTRFETSALVELGRQGLVRLDYGTGALAWKIERATVTDAGRRRLEPPPASG